MVRIDDMYSLEKWLEQMALGAHNTRWLHNCKNCSYNLACVVDGDDKLQPCAITGIRDMANETIEKIRSNRVNQRPHINLFIDRIE